MATKVSYKTTFEVEQVIRPIFTGGSVALDRNSRILATTLGEDAVLTDLATGKQLAKIEGDGEPISTLILTPSASHLIVCSRSLSMRIYALRPADEEGSAVETSLLRTLKPHATPAVVLAVDRTGTLLATGSADGNVKVWDIHGGFATHTLRGPSVLISALHFFEVAASDVATAAPSSAGKDKKKKGKKGSKDKGQDEKQNEVTASGPVPLAARYRLAAGSQDGKVRVWNLFKSTVVANLDGHVSDVQAIDFSAAQNTFLTAGRDKTIIWWDPQTWTTRRVVPAFELIEAAGFLRSGDGVNGDDAEAPGTNDNDDGAVVYSAGSNGRIRLWDTRTGRELTAEQAAGSEEESIVAMIYRPRQAALLSVQMDHTLVLYPVPPVRELRATTSAAARLPPLEPTRRISGTHDDIIDLAFLLPDQSLLALATNSEDVHIVAATDASSSYFGQDVGLLKGHDDIVITIDVDWSGHWIATGAKDNTARLWRVDAAGAAQCYAVFSGHAESVSAVALPKTAPADTASPAFLDPLSHPPAFIMTGSQDLTVKRWEVPRTAAAVEADADNRQQQHHQRAAFTRKAHDKDINALDIDGAGRLFASSSQDRTVKIWSVREGEVQGILRGHRRGVWTVRFAPPHTPAIAAEDGGSSVSGHRGLVLTGSGDKTIKLWSLTDYSCLRTFEGHTNSVLKVVWLDIPVPRRGGADDDEAVDRMDTDEANVGSAGMSAVSSLRHSSSSSNNAPVLFASAGGDGLVKVWDAALGEAVCTLDNHEDRVWALAVRRRQQQQAGSLLSPSGQVLVSGGGDATVSFWRDTTATTAAAAAVAVAERVEQEQQLMNHMRRGLYREAVELALQLNQPGRLLAVLQEAFQSKPGDGSDDGAGRSKVADMEAALAQLSDDQLWTLLLRVRDWNTNARTAVVAQRVLATLVRSYPATRLAKLGRKRSATASTGGGVNKSMQEVLDALLAYTERHYRRMADLLDDSYLVDYTLREMDMLSVEN